MEKTHYRKAFNSPYLSSADIVEPIVLTVAKVSLEADQTKKTRDLFNTAHFLEKEIRHGEQLKPMILNAVNSKTMANLTGSKFIEDWVNVPIKIYVDHNVRFGRETVEGLRISTEAPQTIKQELTPANTAEWQRAVERVAKDGNVSSVLAHRSISQENLNRLKGEANV